jgi:hypothetical protein
MLARIATSCAFLILLVPLTASAGEPKPSRNPTTWFKGDAPAATKLRVLNGKIKHCNDVARFFANHPKPANSLRGRAVIWQHKKMRTWALRRVTEVKREMWRTLPAVNDWKIATIVAQRPYPGTRDWMLSISDREGGWGPWVWYGGRQWNGYHIGNDFLGADTVGGWMQFRFSTFAPYWRGAIKDLRARNFIIPDLGDGYKPWLSPLGQALTAGYMRFYGKDGCHWCL